MMDAMGAEERRLVAQTDGSADWRLWGPYLADRQWATVREDESADGQFWESFPYEQSRARAYRWGEDGLLGLCDRECRLCFAVALWNGCDSHLKERPFGLTGPEGNHSEDCKEVYFFEDATPTHSYLRGSYKYPQVSFPYERLRIESRRRDRHQPEYELIDTGIFDKDRYWDVTVEYGKAAPDDLLVRLTVRNRGPEAAQIHLLPTLWFRNTWTCPTGGAGNEGEGELARPRLTRSDDGLLADHTTLGRYRLRAEPPPADWLFTENETNPEAIETGLRAAVAGAVARVVGRAGGPFKDAFHRAVVDGDATAAREVAGTKAAGVYILDVPPGSEAIVRLRLGTESATAEASPFAKFDALLAERINEADTFYAAKLPAGATAAERFVSRGAYAGLLWSEQFYQYRPAGQPSPMNQDWPHLDARDVVSVPDKWEYPAFFAWDLAFHMVPMARIDPAFAKHQLLLLVGERYQHPNGQLPAFEYDLGNVNPPVHAWACWRVYETDGSCDRGFLRRAFQPLLLYYAWWVNRKDDQNRGLFAGGFLGLDNIGPFDRSGPVPAGGRLEQADATAWMGLFIINMFRIAVELGADDPAFEDAAIRFFDAFMAIGEALNHLDGVGLWDEADGFYYDRVRPLEGPAVPVRARSLVGLAPLFGVWAFPEGEVLARLPRLAARVRRFFRDQAAGVKHAAWLEVVEGRDGARRLLALTGRRRLGRLLRYVFDEDEFLSPFGVRSLSQVHRDHPATVQAGGQTYRVGYVPGDMDSADFGGNSNWRGPIWLPFNFLLVDALREYHAFFSDEVQVEVPHGSGRMVSLGGAADELTGRLVGLFLPDPTGRRPWSGDDRRWADDPHWRDRLLFHEYFHGDTGRGLGASHQTGWTALIATLIEYQAEAPPAS